MCFQGYAAREFAKQGVKPGELAIISKEAVCIFVYLYILMILIFELTFDDCFMGYFVFDHSTHCFM